MPPNRFVGEGIFAVGLRWPGAAIIAHGKNQSGVYVPGAFVTRSVNTALRCTSTRWERCLYGNLQAVLFMLF